MLRCARQAVRDAARRAFQEEGQMTETNAGERLSITRLIMMPALITLAVIMFFAIRGNGGTDYDVLSPGYTGPTSFWGEYLMIGLVPQLVFWVAFTITTGSLFGSVASAVAHRGKTAVQAA